MSEVKFLYFAGWVVGGLSISMSLVFFHYLLINDLIMASVSAVVMIVSLAISLILFILHDTWKPTTKNKKVKVK